MPKASPRKKSAVTGLTEQQEKFVEATLNGASMSEAAKAAGATSASYAHGAMTSSLVQAALAKARSELSDAVQIKRVDIIEGMLDAIELAKLAADPATMIRGYSEIGKMLGFYAPEVKKIEHSVNGRNMVSKYEIMSDEELEALAEGRVYDGESARVQ